MIAKIISSLFICFVCLNANAQNVGIGTTTPANKLSVNGNADFTGKVGIGTSLPVGEIHIKSLPISSSILDQQNQSTTTILGSTGGWQSFTAGTSGFLTKIELYFSAIGATGVSGTIKIYNGEGTSGSLLSTSNIFISTTWGFQTFILPNLVNITAGNKYTIEYGDLQNTLQVAININNPYNGGISSFSGADLVFKTYVANTLDDAIIVTDTKVGIGTSAPLAKLDVSGNVKITDGTQGAGKVLTSDANGLASWTTLANSNWVLTGNAGTSAATHFLGTTDNRSLRFKTNNTQIMIIDSLGKVGIGTSSPLAKLDIAGNVKIADGTQGAGKVFTSDVNGVASWVTPASGWALTGNSGTTAATNFIGTTDNRSLRFRTNNTEKMIIDSLGNIGIGTASPAGLLHIKSPSSSLGTVDQQQTVITETGGAITQWQSFTAGITGQLYRVDLLVSSPISNWYEDGTIKIYSGEGNAGTLLSTTPVTFFYYNPTRFQEYTLSTLVNVTAGNKYTIEFTAQSIANGWVESNSNNPYPGGITSFGSNVDFGFKTYVNPLVDAVIVSDGKVGIGSTNPSSKLEVIGTVRIADGTQGLGKVLTSNANGVASWATLTPASGWALTGNSGTTAATNFIGTTDNRSLRFRTNNTEKMIVDSLGRVGLGFINPIIRLDMDTNQIIGTSRTFVTQHDITNRGTKVSFGYSIPGNEFLGMKAIVKAGTFFCGNSGDIGFYTWECNTSSSREVMRINGSGNVGIGTLAPTAKFSVNGDANNTTGAWSVFSDARIKTVNSDFTDGLNVINKIHPVKFNYNTNAPFKANGEQIGIVAQELEKIAPYMVSQKEYVNIKDLREVNNQAYVFLLINAVKELGVQNEQLKAELEMIKARLGLNTKTSNH